MSDQNEPFWINRVELSGFCTDRDADSWSATAPGTLRRWARWHWCVDMARSMNYALRHGYEMAVQFRRPETQEEDA